MTKYFAEPNKSQKEQEDVGAKLHIDDRRLPVTPREKSKKEQRSILPPDFYFIPKKKPDHLRT